MIVKLTYSGAEFEAECAMFRPASFYRSLITHWWLPVVAMA